VAERRSRKPADAPRGPRPGGVGGAGGLTGGGPSIVGAGGAMRARDVSRPRAADDERAERTVVIRRREPPPEPVERS
jgi:hypothetical protein